LAQEGEPRPEYAPDRPLYDRYAAKAAEVGVVLRTVQRWVRNFQEHGEAGLVPRKDLTASGPGHQVDQRWAETALEVMVEHTGESKPSRTMVIDRTNARVAARFGPDVVTVPSRATAFRVLEKLEQRHPTFRLSTKRNRDIADRPDGVYGKLRPTRPGEYVLLDTTQLDVFALDPVTLRWINSELALGVAAQLVGLADLADEPGVQGLAGAAGESLVGEQVGDLGVGVFLEQCVDFGDHVGRGLADLPGCQGERQCQGVVLAASESDVDGDVVGPMANTSPARTFFLEGRKTRRFVLTSAI
jgi:hypothetical protein